MNTKVGKSSGVERRAEDREKDGVAEHQSHREAGELKAMDNVAHPATLLRKANYSDQA